MFVRTTLFASVLLLVSSVSAVADTLEDEANQLIDTALTSSLSMELVTSLTTEIGPRLAGSEAEQRARDWAVRKLSNMGFSNVHVEDFDMPGWERGQISIQVGAPYAQPL
ncbi:Aminopeptidase CC_2544, partial [hydrothermal vent metagenome]